MGRVDKLQLVNARPAQISTAKNPLELAELASALAIMNTLSPDFVICSPSD
jgi:hypothetical protein